MRFLTYTIIALLISFFATAGCSSEDDSECGVAISKIEKQEELTSAIQQAANAKCTDAADPLKALYDDGKNQNDILTAVQTLGDNDLAAYIIGKALFNKELGVKAAKAAHEMNLKAVIPQLKQLFTDRRASKSARKPALEALMDMVGDKKELEDILIRTLNGDPGSQGIDANRLAAKELGAIRSVKAVPDLIQALFVSTKTAGGGTHRLFAAARVGLAGVGAPAVPLLLKAMTGGDPDFNKFTRSQQIPKWQWKWGTEFPVVLSDIRDPAAAAVLAKDIIARDMVLYEGLSPEQRDVNNDKTEKIRKAWQKAVLGAQVQSVWALGRFGSDDAVEFLTPVVNNIDKGAEQRVFAQMALMLIGTPKAVDALVSTFEKETTVSGKYTLISNLALGLGPNDLEKGWAFVRKAEAKKESRKEREVGDAIREKLNPSAPGADASKRAKAQYKEDVKAAAAIKAWISLAEAAKTKGDAVYISAIEDNSFEEDIDYANLTKAAVMLARGGKNQKAFTTLLRGYKKVDPRKDADVRSYLLIALGRTGGKSDASRVRQAMDSLVDTQGKPKKGKRGSYNELRALEQYLNNMER